MNFEGASARTPPFRFAEILKNRWRCMHATWGQLTLVFEIQITFQRQLDIGPCSLCHREFPRRQRPVRGRSDQRQ